MQKNPEIENSIVLVKEDENKNKYLAAYLIPKTKKDCAKFNFYQLCMYLKKHLPYYMIPVIFFELKHFPLTSNKKIDQRKLMALEEDEAIRPIPYLPPTSVTEKQLVLIWSQALMILQDQIGIDDDFFML